MTTRALTAKQCFIHSIILWGCIPQKTHPKLVKLNSWFHRFQLTRNRLLHLKSHLFKLIDMKGGQKVLLALNRKSTVQPEIELLSKAGTVLNRLRPIELDPPLCARNKTYSFITKHLLQHLSLRWRFFQFHRKFKLDVERERNQNQLPTWRWHMWICKNVAKQYDRDRTVKQFLAFLWLAPNTLEESMLVQFELLNNVTFSILFYGCARVLSHFLAFKSFAQLNPPTLIRFVVSLTNVEEIK